MQHSDPSCFDTLGSDLRQDPYPHYARLRDQARVAWSKAENAWILTGYKDVVGALADPSLGQEQTPSAVRRIAGMLGEALPELQLLLDAVLFFRNPPSHQGYRRQLARALGARSQSGLAEAIEGFARDLIAPLTRDDEIDLVREFAEPLPPLVMGWLYGLGRDDARWLAATLAGVPAVIDRAQSIRVYRRLEPRLTEVNAFFRAEIAKRRRAPGDDALSVLVRLNAEAETPRNDRALAATATFLFVAGFETTAGMIGSGLWLILTHPGQRARLAANTELLPAAVEETLRMEPPIQQTSRLVPKSRVISGTPMDAGQRLLLLIGAANRDPAAYPDPDRFQPGRTGPPPLSFGAGPHACLGAGIARLEARIAFEHVVRQPGLHITGDRLEWWPNQNQRRLKNLRVRLSH